MFPAGVGAVFRPERGAGGAAQRDAVGAAADHGAAALGRDRQGAPQVRGERAAAGQGLTGLRLFWEIQMQRLEFG